MSKLLLSSFLFFPLVACGGASYEIATGDLSGTVNGSSWSLSSATTSSFFSDDTQYSATLFGGEDVMGCDDGFVETTAPEVLVSVPKEVGTHELLLDLFGPDNLTVTVVPGPGQNVILSTGIMEVESIDGDTIRAGLFATDAEGMYELSGWFDIPVCAE